MDPSSLQIDDDRFRLESQIRECFGRTAYAHKTHEKMAERLSAYLNRVKLIQIVLAAVTSAGAIGVVFDATSPWLPLVTALLSIATLIANSYLKDVDPGGLAQKHRETASDIWNVRESYLSLLTDLRDQAFTLETIRSRRDGLQDQLYKIYKTAPHTDGDAYRLAQDALKRNEDLTFSDAEIDTLLPSTLKRAAVADPDK